MTELTNRYDFVLLFDVQDGNPNGDPDAGNLPRIDPETGHGLVTDVCLKRKLRNYVLLTRAGTPGYDIYVKEKAILSAVQGQAYAALGLSAPAAGPGPGEDETEKSGDGAEESAAKKGKKPTKAPGKKSSDGQAVERARDWMCQQFFDVRAFGAVMSLKENNCGQVRGPVQLTFSRSIEPIVAQEHSITRVAVATQAEADKQGGDNRTMGRKNTVPYGLYCGYGFISPLLAKQTGFSAEDVEVLWDAIQQMFEHDRSAARGLMTLRKLILFQHESVLGNAPAHRLFELVAVTPNHEGRPARSFTDYTVTIGSPPAGVKVTERSP
jgi:CRISPR-associated protein Csd2